MSDIIDAIRQGAGQVLSEIDQKGQLKSAFDGIRHQLSELERRRKANSLEGELKALQAEMKQLTEALGLQTLSLFDAGKVTHPELARLCERINELRADIEGKKAQLESLITPQSVSERQCPHCQARVASDADFCPKCGTQLQKPASAPVAEASAEPRAVVRLRCPKCKTILDPDAAFCPTCGVKIKPLNSQVAPKQFCAACGAEMAQGARFCPICGQPVS
jgi:rRNA maturation endonuclease Nob1